MATATQTKKTKYLLVDEVIPKILTSICYEAPFDAGKKLVESRGFHIPSADENARLRIQEGEQAYCSNKGNWVTEGPLYFKGDNTRLLRRGLPYLHPREAAEVYETKKKYTNFDKKEVEKGREEGLKVEKSDLDNKGWIQIPTDSLGSNKYGIWF